MTLHIFNRSRNRHVDHDHLLADQQVGGQCRQVGDCTPVTRPHTPPHSCVSPGLIRVKDISSFLLITI